ncbi:DUF2332 domain-containing protein [Ornithinibacillus gellani]|uniref:DUF2332 domain-containing protein n=1 Tax=Ornithinibacillus gellani TaxID=2293253 RepID=UPI000F478E4A|nr:DUF2332 domain-containing protein [Ornithinibacillus gellani]TQS75390.1 DUF2332 domain-containing protein [Ornithinibacillus gellani]
MDDSKLSTYFVRFAEEECKGSCTLYEKLSIEVAKDKQLLDMCLHTRKDQPIPNLFFAAVQYLLDQDKDHVLRGFYGSMTENPRSPELCFPIFKRYCLERKQAIQELLREKLVQTNEVRRCSYLFPSFCLVQERAKKPITFIELGTSAGLQLLWDQYSYQYHDGQVLGSKQSAVLIEAKTTGTLPNLHQFIPNVAARIGLDLHINDVSKTTDCAWLKALIWPSHHVRRKLFEQAAAVVRAQPPELIEGDGVSLLPKLIARIPEQTAICIFHTHVANQLPKRQLSLLMQNIDVAGKNRDLYHIYNNIGNRFLHLDSYPNGKRKTERLAETAPHGNWFNWLLPEERGS